MSSKGPSANVVQDGFGIYKMKQDLRQNNKPVWKHVNRDIYIFFNGGCIRDFLFLTQSFVEQKYWYIGPDFTFDSGLISSSERGHLFLPTFGWKYYDGRNWLEDETLSIQSMINVSF